MATEIVKFNKRLEALKTERSSFVSVWRELSDYHLAARGRFLVTDRNKGNKRNTKQLNNTSRMAVRTLAGGMMSGITSPARPWFRLSTSDPGLREYKPVKEWLNRVQSVMYEVYAGSNIYNNLHSVYGELGVFGTGAIGVFDNFQNVIHSRQFTVGSYYLAMNGENIVDTFYREYEVTVAQCVKQFGIENCSDAVQNHWKKGNTEIWIPIVHLIEPNDDRDMMSPLARDKKFRSVYYEKATASKSEDKFLRRSGFDAFPILTPRWDVTGEDVYATDCPGMVALGDTKALQLGERRSYQALDRLLNPPLQGPSSLRNSGIGDTLRDGDIVYNDNPNGKLTSIYEFRPDLNAMVAVNDRAEVRIKRAFYEDLFLMLANSDRRQITAREVAEKHEEKLLMLGPVLERLHSELLDPLIDITFEKLQGAGVLPIPPKELQNSEMSVEYVSVLAQAQRMVASGSLERLGSYVGQLATVWPEARHKFDSQQAVDEYAEALGVAPNVIRSDDEVAAIMQQEQDAAAQQAAMQQGMAMADAAKTVSETNTSGDNALGVMLRNAGLQ